MLEAVLAFLAGLLIGSFLNVCVYRLPRDLSVVRPRSHCPACEKQIAWYDNIPVLSYLILGGRVPALRRADLVALSAGGVGDRRSVRAVRGEAGPNLARAEIFACSSAILITLIATDLEERILPDEFTLGGTVLGIRVCRRLGQRTIWLIGWLYQKFRHREGMGLGDVKMIAMIGAFLGFQDTLLTLILASVLGSVAGGAYALITKKDIATYELPFGSFIGVAGLAVALWSHVFRVS